MGVGEVDGVHVYVGHGDCEGLVLSRREWCVGR